MAASRLRQSSNRNKRAIGKSVNGGLKIFASGNTAVIEAVYPKERAPEIGDYIADSRWTFIRGLARETSQSAVFRLAYRLDPPRWRNRFLLAPSTERE